MPLVRKWCLLRGAQAHFVADGTFTGQRANLDCAEHAAA
jgi:hypothetical protein